MPNGRAEGERLNTEIVGFHVGSMAFVFLPGEPFVETALGIRARSPFEVTAIVGYAEDYIGYVPTDPSFVEGGYETVFGGWSVLAPGSEPALGEATIALLDDLYADVGSSTTDRGETAGEGRADSRAPQPTPPNSP
jgi:hypothetical protein